MFDSKFGKCGPIFKILSPLLIRNKIIHVVTTKISTSPAKNVENRSTFKHI